VYLSGYWQAYSYFQDMREQLVSELQPIRPLPDSCRDLSTALERMPRADRRKGARAGEVETWSCLSSLASSSPSVGIHLPVLHPTLPCLSGDARLEDGAVRNHQQRGADALLSRERR
jgi:hypothetical protein